MHIPGGLSMIKLKDGEIMLEKWEAVTLANIIENILYFEHIKYLNKDNISFLSDKLDFMREDYNA